MTYKAKKVPVSMTSERAGGTRELAIEWIEHVTEEAIYGYGGCSEWLGGERSDVDEDLCSDVDSWTEELVAQLPRYVEIAELLKIGSLQAAFLAAKIAKELK